MPLLTYKTHTPSLIFPSGINGGIWCLLLTVYGKKHFCWTKLHSLLKILPLIPHDQLTIQHHKNVLQQLIILQKRDWGVVPSLQNPRAPHTQDTPGEPPTYSQSLPRLHILAQSNVLSCGPYSIPADSSLAIADAANNGYPVDNQCPCSHIKPTRQA